VKRTRTDAGVARAEHTRETKTSLTNIRYVTSTIADYLAGPEVAAVGAHVVSRPDPPSEFIGAAAEPAPAIKALVRNVRSAGLSLLAPLVGALDAIAGGGIGGNIVGTVLKRALLQAATLLPGLPGAAAVAAAKEGRSFGAAGGEAFLHGAIRSWEGLAQQRNRAKLRLAVRRACVGGIGNSAGNPSNEGQEKRPPSVRTMPRGGLLRHIQPVQLLGGTFDGIVSVLHGDVHGVLIFMQKCVKFVTIS